MPLSRLSPRSSRKGLQPRGKANGRSKGTTNGHRSRHLNLWEAIRLTREELDNWNALSSYIENLFRDLVLPREQRITRTLYQLTASLINHLDNTDRAPAERSLMGLWVIQNIETLKNHPFAEQSECQVLLNSLSLVLDDANTIDSQLIKLLQRHRIGASDVANKEHSKSHSQTSETFSEHTQSEVEEESDEPLFDFGWHKKTPPKENTPQQNAHYKDTAHSDTVSEPEREDDFIDPAKLDEKIKKSQKNLSIDRLFRQLAKVLHPDREQDETLKASKHLLMSQCLEARQKDDVDTLLRLYCEHVGELPEDLNDNSQQELVSALELQLKLLQRELRQQRFGDALRTQIVERYSDSSNHKIEAKIALHAKNLDKQIKQTETEIHRLTTHAGLQAVLKERRSIELDRMTIDEITANY